MIAHANAQCTGVRKQIAFASFGFILPRCYHTPDVANSLDEIFSQRSTLQVDPRHTSDPRSESTWNVGGWMHRPRNGSFLLDNDDDDDAVLVGRKDAMPACFILLPSHTRRRCRYTEKRASMTPLKTGGSKFGEWERQAGDRPLIMGREC